MVEGRVVLSQWTAGRRRHEAGGCSGKGEPRTTWRRWYPERWHRAGHRRNAPAPSVTSYPEEKVEAQNGQMGDPGRMLGSKQREVWAARPDPGTARSRSSMER